MAKMRFDDNGDINFITEVLFDYYYYFSSVFHLLSTIGIFKQLNQFKKFIYCENVEFGLNLYGSMRNICFQISNILNPARIQNFTVYFSVSQIIIINHRGG